jgi:quinol monooxygenase YgiN
MGQPLRKDQCTVTKLTDMRVTLEPARTINAGSRPTEGSLMFGLVVRFNIRDEEAAAQFDALTREAVEQISAEEPGTLIYATHIVEDEPLARVFYEVYADREAFQTHEDAEHVKAFHAAKNPLLVGEHRVEFLMPGPAKGLSVS